MPNWCDNTITLRAEKEDIQKLKNFLDERKGKDWFDFFLPCPQELKDVGNVSFHEPENEALIQKYGHSDWYTWSVDNWGCKWNCDAFDWEVNEEGTEIYFRFDSPWGPPIKLYEFIEMSEEFEYEVEALYFEGGMAFIGEFANGFDNCYEYSDLESLDSIPEHIVEHYDLRQMLEDQAEWDNENE